MVVWGAQTGIRAIFGRWQAGLLDAARLAEENWVVVFFVIRDEKTVQVHGLDRYIMDRCTFTEVMENY